MPTEALALPPVAWECANCAHTNEGTEPGPCSGCGAIDPIRYMIWKRQGGVLAPSAINARVDRSLQCLLSANTNEQNASAAPRRVDVVAAMVGSMVDVVGIHAKNRGILHVREVYTERCMIIVRRNKMHRNDGCAVAVVLGDRKCLEL